MNLSDGLKRLRKELNISQSELAVLLGVSYATVSRWENGKAVPTKSVIASVMSKIEKLDVTKSCIDYLKKAFAMPYSADTDKTGYVDMSLANQIINEDSASIVVCAKDTYKILYMNLSAKKLMGTSNKKYNGTACYSFLENKNAPCEHCLMNRDNPGKFTEQTVKLADGRTVVIRGKDIEWEGVPARIEYINDISNMERIHQPQLDLLNRMPGGVGIYYLYPDGRIELGYLNDGFYKMLGETREDRKHFTGFTTFHSIHPDDKTDFVAELFSSVRENRSAEAKIRIINKSGIYRWYNAKSTIASHDKTRDAVYLAFNDIDELVQAQKKSEVLATTMQSRMKLEQDRIKHESDRLGGYVVTDLTTGEIVDHSPYAPNAPYADKTLNYAENITEALKSVVYEDDKQAFTRVHDVNHLLSEFKNGHMSEKIEFRRAKPDGMIGWVRNVLHLVEDPSTTHVMLYEYCYDINATKSVEVVTNAAIIETFDCLASIDVIHNQTTFLSQRNVRSGKNVVMDIYSDIAEQYINEYVIEADRPFCRETFAIEYIKRELDTKPNFETSYRVILDGEQHIMRNKYTYYDKKKHRCLLMRTDVTEIVKQEEEQRHKTQLAQVMDSFPGGLVTFGNENPVTKRYPIIYCSQGVAELSQYDVDTFVDIYENNIQKLIFKADQTALHAQMQKLYNTGEPLDMTYRAFKKDGSIFWVRECASVIKDENGGKNIVAVFQNVSEDTKLYQDIIDSSQNVIQVIDRETRELYYANEAAKQYTGKSNYAGLHCYEFFADRKEPCDFCNFCNGQLEATKEMEIKGQSRTFMARANFTDWHGRKVYTEILTDITKHKEMQSYYESYISSIAQNVTDAAVAGRINISQNICSQITSKHEHFASTSKAQSISDFVMYGASFICDVTERKKYIEIFARDNLLEAFSKGNNVVAFQHQCEFDDGTINIMESSVHMSLNPETGDIEGVLYSTDVTQDEINNRIFTTLLSDQYEGIELIDVSTGRCSVRQFGIDVKRTELIKNDDYEQSCLLSADNYIHPEDKDAFLQNSSISNLVDKLGKMSIYVYTIRNMIHGKVFTKKCKYCYIGKGKSTIMGTIEDVTALVEEAEQHREKLEKALAMANAATDAKSDFLARMSHDLRTPINTIVGLRTLALDDVDNVSLVKENLSKMHEATDYMLSLVNDLLDMSEIETGKAVLHESLYKYHDFIGMMETMFRPQCEKKGITLTIQSEKNNPEIIVDKLKLNRVFSNIFSNAVKYTNPGGKIDYHIENLTFKDKILSGDFIIADNGIGMDKNFQKHMYEAFTQEDENIKSDLQGSGVGLSITKRLVEMLGGTIKITSKKGVGTTVKMHFDFKLAKINADETVRQAVSNMTNEDAVLDGKNVLLVEDHPLNAQIAKKLLEKKKINVTLAENGRVAIDKFANSAKGYFNAVLMDIRMPVMDGLEASRQIRALKRDDAKIVPIIAMSANAYDEDKLKSKEAGMNEHIAKPVDPPKMYSALAQQMYVSQNIQ